MGLSTWHHNNVASAMYLAVLQNEKSLKLGGRLSTNAYLAEVFFFCISVWGKTAILMCIVPPFVIITTWENIWGLPAVV